MTEKTSMLAILGAKWLSIGVVTQRIYQALVVVVLARILVPKDFGLVAIAVLTINVVSRIQVLGMSGALVQRQENIREAANVFFYVNCFIAVLLYGAIFSSSSLIAGFFGNASADLVLRIMGLQLFIDAACVVQQTLAVKELKFKRQTLITLCDSFVSGSISIVLALKGYGVWSMVFGPLAGGALGSGLWWLCSEWRPSLCFHRKVTKEILGFGVQLFAISTLDSSITSCNRIFIGRFLGITSLGLYDLASRVINLPCQNIISIGQQVSLPAFCQIRQDLELVKRWYLKMTEYSYLLLCPIVGSLIVLGDLFVAVFFGEKWLLTIPLIRILALYALMMPFLYTWSVYVCVGRADLLLKFTVVRFMVTASLLFGAAQIGLIAVCLAEAIGIWIFAPVNLYIVMKQLRICGDELVHAIRAPLRGGLAFTFALVLLRWGSAHLYDKADLISLIGIIVPAFGIYVASIYFFNRDTFGEIKNMIGISLGRKREVPVGE